VRRPALSAIVAAALLIAPATIASAHLLPSGATSLLGMMAAADGMLVARAAAATHERDAKLAATPFLARETIAGDAPSGGFVLEQKAPILRYAEIQDALLLVARDRTSAAAARWVSVQPAGAGIVLDKPKIEERSRTVLVELWGVAHPAAGATPDLAAATGALVAALSLPEAKLRALAFLDLATLADDPSHFSPLAASRLLRYGDGPEDDAQLKDAVRGLGRKIAASEAARAAVAGTGASKP
jgi:hypothetical protein